MSDNKNKKTNHTDETANILFQKMGDRWYAFSVIEDEVFMGTLPEDLILEGESNADLPNEPAA